MNDLKPKRIIVTGGAGFIGSAVVRYLISQTAAEVLNVDCLTYAGNLMSLRDVNASTRYTFSQTDICNAESIRQLIRDFKPDAIMHLAAESHVDRSIDGPTAFVRTNVTGTFNLLEAARSYLQDHAPVKPEAFRFLHVSTDEVYGSLGATGLFSEQTAYDPHSPYAASKAASDHFVQAWFHTYQLPVLMTNCSNNYGPFQFPEKLIPLTILNALEGRPLPVYGRGDNVRDWLHVDDHAHALYTILSQGTPGKKYNIGGANERTNLQVVEAICDILDQSHPCTSSPSRRQLIRFVSDRPGHDQRYGIDASYLRKTLGWIPNYAFEDGLRQTIEWYVHNKWWWEPIREKKYKGERLGVQGT